MIQSLFLGAAFNEKFHVAEAIQAKIDKLKAEQHDALSDLKRQQPGKRTWESEKRSEESEKMVSGPVRGVYALCGRAGVKVDKKKRKRLSKSKQDWRGQLGAA